MRRRTILLALTLTGCASTSALDIGGGRYSISAHAIRGFSVAREEAVENANEFCGSRGHAVVESFQDTFVGATYETYVIFRCGDTQK